MSSFNEPTSHRLKSLFIKNFRNIAFAELGFGEGHHLFVGPNGQGKTNCLEAIAMACSLRPMQALQNVDLIKFQEEEAKISAEFFGHQRLEIDIFPLGKKARLNEHPLRAAQELTKSISLVSFIPADLTMISGTSALRRRALDQASAALFFEHASAIRGYEKLLAHRNRLLKEWPVDKTLLKSFTDLLIKEGAQVIFCRLQAIEIMQSIFSCIIKEILGLNHVGTLGYFQRDRVVGKHTLNDLQAKLTDEHNQVVLHEQRRKVTLFGPHLDDLVFELDGINAKRAASRGQSRTMIFAFKLAQMLAIEKIRGQAPIVILDDIVSELDANIKINLIQTINNLKTQSFFSATDVKTFGGDLRSISVYHVDKGFVGV